MLLLLSVAESLHSAVSTKHICVVSICGLQHTVCGMAKVSFFFFVLIRAQWPIFNHPWGEKWWRREGAGGRSLTLTFTSIQPFFFFFFLQQHWTCSEWEREERREERDRVGGRETERQTGQCCAEGARCSYAEGCHSCCFSLKCASNVGCFQIHRGVVLLLLLLLLLLERSGRARRALCASRSTSPWTQRNHRERERGRGREGETTKCVLSWANAGDGWRLIVAQLSGEDCGQGRSLHCARTETPILPAPRILFFSFFFFFCTTRSAPENVISGESQEGQRDYCRIWDPSERSVPRRPLLVLLFSLCVCVCVWRHYCVT